MTQLAQVTLAMTSTVLIGVFCSDLQGSPQTITTEFRDVALTTSPALAYTHTTTDSGNYTLTAVDAQSNESSATVALTTGPLISSQTARYNPGDYIAAGSKLYNHTRADRYAVYDQAAASAAAPNLKGLNIVVPWGMIENPGPGDYIWSELDAEFTKATQLGWKVIIDFWFMVFSGSYAFPSIPQSTASNAKRALPDYLYTQNLVSSSEGTNDNIKVFARLDLPACYQHFLNLVTALNNRYADNPAFEQFIVSETTCQAADLGYTLANWHAAITNICLDTVAIIRKASVVCMGAYQSDGTIQSVRNMVAQHTAAGVGPASPDINANNSYDNWQALVYRGAGTTFGDGNDYGTIDYRGQACANYQQQVINSASWTPQIIQDHAETYYGITHLVWSAHRPAYTTDGSTRVPALDFENVLAYLAGNPTSVLGRPTNLP